MELPKNKFKAALGRPQIGFWCSLANAYAAEIIAGAGYDWLLLDTEHAPADLETVLRQLQAVAAYDVAPIVRPASNDAVLIKRYLDIGVQTLLIPYVQSAEEARRAVAATRYAPAGMRGVAAAMRASGFGRVANYARDAAKELCVLVQVETREALTVLEQIASVDGVDGIFIGPNDLAASLGHAGDPGHESVRAAIEGAIKRIVALGKPCGILSPDLAYAKRAMGLGVSFAAIGGDVALLARGSENLLAQFRAAP